MHEPCQFCRVMSGYEKNWCDEHCEYAKAVVELREVMHYIELVHPDSFEYLEEQRTCK